MLCEYMLVREWINIYVSWIYAGRYEPLCADGALMYRPLVLDLYRWTPRQVKPLDEALRRLRPVAEEDDVPRTNSSHWCNCTVTSSEGSRFVVVR